MDMIEGPVAKVEKIEDKLELFIKYARRFGVPEVMEKMTLTDIMLLLKEFLFDPVHDLLNAADIPKVTRCLAIMAKLAKVKGFEDMEVVAPEEETSIESTE